jgi:hypothetical protein
MSQYMGIDKLKITYTIKLCVLGLYLMYLTLFNSILHNYLPSSINSDGSVKEKLIYDSCIFIIGGSNARQGLSAQLLSKNICPTLNISINNEMNDFNLYLHWLSNNLTGKNYQYILYSTKFFWADKPEIKENFISVFLLN